LKKLIYIFFFFNLTSCIQKSELKDVFPTYLLHNNNAKVWILKNTSNPDRISYLDDYRQCFIFFSNYTFIEQELILLGSKNGEAGKYEIIHKKNRSSTLKIIYDTPKKESFQFNILNLTNKELSLQDSDSVKYIFESLHPPKLHHLDTLY